MKSLFARLFTILAVILIIFGMLITAGITVETRHLLDDHVKSTLSNDAGAIADIASSYDDIEDLEKNWSFQVMLSLSAELSQANYALCDRYGEVLQCSCQTAQFEHNDAMISADLLTEAADNGSSYQRGTMNDFFIAPMYSVLQPVYSSTSGELLCYILAFSDVDDAPSKVAVPTLFIIVLTVIALAVMLVFVYITVRKETKPLNSLSQTVQDFGHGNYAARASVNNSCSDEIRQLANSFNIMADSIEKSEQQRREFVADVSHELKTPMTTIAGFIDGMLDGTIPEELHPKYMQTVSNEVRRLSRLVRNMLEVSKIQDKGISEEQKSKFDICEMTDCVLLTFEQKINGKSLNVDIQMPDHGLQVTAAADYINQVIYNLVDNAVKFCNPSGDLFVQVNSDGQNVYFNISNTGPTIAPDELPLVFDRFHKADKSRSQNKDGVGLGLYIVKTIITAHNGDISVSSRDGVTRFSFSLPQK